MRRVAFILVLVALARTTNAATYYVSTSGDDRQTCTAAQDVNTPKRSVNGGIGCLSGGGDTLLIRAGTYAEQIGPNIASGSSWDNKVRIAAYPSETVSLRPVGTGFVVALGSLPITRCCRPGQTPTARRPPNWI